VLNFPLCIGTNGTPYNGEWYPPSGTEVVVEEIIYRARPRPCLWERSRNL